MNAPACACPVNRRLVRFVQHQPPGLLNPTHAAIVALTLGDSTPWVLADPGVMLRYSVTRANIIHDPKGIWKPDLNGTQQGINFTDPQHSYTVWPNTANHGTLIELEFKYANQSDAEAVPVARIEHDNRFDAIPAPAPAYYRLRLADPGENSLSPDGILMNLFTEPNSSRISLHP